MNDDPFEHPYVPMLADLINLDPRFQWYVVDFEWPCKEDCDGQCWLWSGYSNPSGTLKNQRYGRIRVPGRTASQAAVYVHRYVYELFWGSIPEGFEIHHLCDRGLCCNPSHLVALDPEEHDSLHDRIRDARGRYTSKFW